MRISLHHRPSLTACPIVSPGQIVKFKRNGKLMGGFAISHSNRRTDMVDVTTNGKKFLLSWSGTFNGWVSQN